MPKKKKKYRKQLRPIQEKTKLLDTQYFKT